VSRIKCVVWDLDGTVWPGVAIERPAGTPAPTPYPEVLAMMDLLERRGIVSSVASRTAPAVAETVRTHPDLAGRVVAVQASWDDKSAAIGRISEELGIDPSAVALVDDNPFERAEVAALLPQVRVLAPEELPAVLDEPAFRPAVVTDDARARGARYRQERQRREASRVYASDREAFLHASGIRLVIRPAREADLARITELVERTHRFNTTGEPWSQSRLSALVSDPGWCVGTAHLTDRYGDYGLIGLVLLRRAVDDTTPRRWHLHLLAVSCRAAGRDVPTALLRWSLARAAGGGAAELVVDVRATDANLELRVLLRRAGFTLPTAGGAPLSPAVPAATGAVGPLLRLHRGTGDALAVPSWLRVEEEP
jgi:methoxymalonate biosynthesis protein